MAQKHQPQQLMDIGLKLERPPPSKDALIRLLKQLANYLSELDQSPSPSILEAMKPSLDALAKVELLKHQDKDVKVLVATCICEITRITAPEPPYNDEVLRDIFYLFIWTFTGLGDINSPLFGRRVVILETLARYKSCVIMLDLECGNLITEMFNTFFSIVSGNHPENVFLSMRTIMTLILVESETVPENLLYIILSTLGRKKGDVSPAARNLSMRVIKHCKSKLEAPIKQFLLSSISGDSSAPSNLLDYHEVIYDIYQCAPKILFGIVPYITGELLNDRLDIRLKTVNLLGDLFALPGISLSEPFKLLFSEFLKRLSDRVVEVRLSVVEHARNCLISNISRAEGPDILSALSDRLLDYDENVRKKAVGAIFDVACHKLGSVPSATAKIVAERLRDKSVSVKQFTVMRLAELYRSYCQDKSGLLNTHDFEWIPGKIMRCLYDRDFGSDTVDGILCHSFFPCDLSVQEKVKHWIEFFSLFDKVEVKALEQMLVQKQRLQTELQKYLSLRETCKEGGGHEQQKKLLGCFRVMSRFFSDSAKTEETFLLFNQLKDSNIWRNLSCLLDPSTSFSQSWTYRDELLQILGENHPLYEFTSVLSVKISFLFVNKEIIKEILDTVATSVSNGNNKLMICMNLLAVFAYSFPFLFSGFEETLISMLKEDNGVVKEGISHVLAKGGGILREKLTITSSSVDLLLERLCLEGSRNQAKYAVQALAAITKDDGLKALSVIYKRLVDMLEKRTHLPSILQSLGAIAQHAMPIFETREIEIVDFITQNILQCNNNEEVSQQKIAWNHQSELCKLKVFGLKTLVKSFMPIKDGNLRSGIENLLEILKCIFLYGDISKGIKSSPVDKAHMRLAAGKAVIRLSKQWEQKIPVDVIYLTFRTLEDTFLDGRRQFKSKVHQYIKERLLDAKYTCTFLVNITESGHSEFAEDKLHLVEIIQMHNQLRARQIPALCDVNPSSAYPEYVLPWFIHALAHHPSLPSIEKKKDVRAFLPIYLRLHMFLSVFFHGDETFSLSDAYSGRIKERFDAVASILQSIKLSEDSINKGKTKNSHALCDLGLSIAKHLVHEQGDVAEIKTGVPLPVEIYKQCKMSDGDLVKVEQSWLGGATVLKEFQSLTLECEGFFGNHDSVEPSTSDIDVDSSDLPLGAILKKLKSRATKRRKALKKKPPEVKKTENLVDMVKEVNLDSQEEDNTGVLRYAKENKPSVRELELAHKRNLHEVDKNINVMYSYVPKKKRSSFGIPRKYSQDQKRNGQSLQPPELEGSESEKKPASDSDLLVSCMSVSKNGVSADKRTGPQKNINGKASSVEVENTSKNASFPGKYKRKCATFSESQSRKQKRKSIARLEKCSQKIMEDSSFKLVGCRIKVWWPLDKRYYEGKVESYDRIKMKHVVLYDDGDREVLHLHKELWKLIDGDVPSKKKLKTRHPRVGEKSGCFSLPDANGKSVDNSTKKSTRKNRKPTSKRKNIKGKKIVDNHKDFGDSPRNVPDGEPDDGSTREDNHSGRQQESTRSREGEAKMEKADTTILQKTLKTADEGCPIFSGEHQNSDDEPLNAWRQRVRK